MTRIFEHKNNVSLTFYCPACKSGHTINKSWQYDGNKDLPTISPSVLLTGTTREGEVYSRCHSFVKQGKIQFLDDCLHDMKGQTVDLPEIESLTNYSFGE